MKYEYKQLRTNKESDGFVKLLDSVVVDDWELVSVFNNHNDCHYLASNPTLCILMRRPIHENT